MVFLGRLSIVRTFAAPRWCAEILCEWDRTPTRLDLGKTQTRSTLHWNGIGMLRLFSSFSLFSFFLSDLQSRNQKEWNQGEHAGKQDQWAQAILEPMNKHPCTADL